MSHSTQSLRLAIYDALEKSSHLTMPELAQLVDSGAPVTQAQVSAILRGKPDVYDGFIMHLDEVVTLPPGATLLAVNDHTHVQAIEVKHQNGTRQGYN